MLNCDGNDYVYEDDDLMLHDRKSSLTDDEQEDLDSVEIPVATRTWMDRVLR